MVGVGVGVGGGAWGLLCRRYELPMASVDRGMKRISFQPPWPRCIWVLAQVSWPGWGRPGDQSGSMASVYDTSWLHLSLCICRLRLVHVVWQRMHDRLIPVLVECHPHSRTANAFIAVMVSSSVPPARVPPCLSCSSQHSSNWMTLSGPTNLVALPTEIGSISSTQWCPLMKSTLSSSMRLMRV